MKTFIPIIIIILGLLATNVRSEKLLIAIHADRTQLFKDALGWMTFRKNGQLMKDTEYEPLFLLPLKEKYISSKFYRTFVIAFQHGVIPGLTLNLNDPCDPEYTWRYKEPFNASVTFEYQKKFTFQAYDNRGQEKFCDYRQGLICSPKSRTCQCPEGAKMETIDPYSRVQRCLLQQDETCSLIDIDHGNDPHHSLLAENLHHIIFNLEKPLSCKSGTQCRFKETNKHFPSCFDVNGGPWYPPAPTIKPNGQTYVSWSLGFGRECALGLYASPGSCEVPSWSSKKIGVFKGYICYNFGPPKSKISSNPANRTGFCAHEYGPYGISNSFSSDNYQIHHSPYISAFFHQRNIPFRNQEMQDYAEKYINGLQVAGESFHNAQEGWEGASCSVQKTKKWEEIWTFFSGLEKDPPPGLDFVPEATKANLDLKMQEFLDLGGTEGKVCKVYLDYYRDTPDRRKKTNEGLKCVLEGTPDSEGNDGKCREPGNLDTVKFADRLLAFFDATAIVELDRSREEERYRKEILKKYPEPECIPGLERLPPSGRNNDIEDTLEGGYCPDDYVCWENYNDEKNIYEDCELKPSVKLEFACHATGDSIHYGNCEGKQLEVEVMKAFEKMVDYSMLGRGATCRYDLEKEIRNWIRNGNSPMNKYKLLAMLEKERKFKGEGFCDRTKLLECSKNNVCECLEDTESRKVTIGGIEYQSDYCYLTKGSCDRNIKQLGIFTKSEEAEMKNHYGEPDYYCQNGNVCVYFDEENHECTKEETGKTGHDLKPKPSTSRPVVVGGGGGAGGPGRRHAGGAENIQASKVVVGVAVFAALYKLA